MVLNLKKFVTFVLKAFAENLSDVFALAHGVEMHCGHSVGYQVLALHSAPFPANLVNCILVVLDFAYGVSQFDRDVQ